MTLYVFFADIIIGEDLFAVNQFFEKVEGSFISLLELFDYLV